MTALERVVSEFVDEFTDAELDAVVSDEFLDPETTGVYRFDEETKPLRLTDRELAELRRAARRPKVLRHPSWG